MPYSYKLFVRLNIHLKLRLSCSHYMVSQARPFLLKPNHSAPFKRSPACETRHCSSLMVYLSFHHVTRRQLARPSAKCVNATCYMLHTVFVNNLHSMTLGLLIVRCISKAASCTDSMSTDYTCLLFKLAEHSQN